MWSFVSHTIPLYSLYSLLFVESGLSRAQVSALLTIWSVVGIVAEVPSGALADRFSRRGALVASTMLQAIGYALWIAEPTFGGFAIGFALWGSGSSLSSGTFEALLYDGLAASHAEDRYPGVIARATALGLVAQIPAAGLASALFVLGGFALVGWVSVGVCLLVSVLACALPDHRPPSDDAKDATDASDASDATDDDRGYLDTLRAGLRVVGSMPLVRRAAIVVAMLFGLDAMEEYFPLQIQSTGVRTVWVPILVLLIPLGGALGAALSGRGAHLSSRALGMLLSAAAGLLGLAAVWTRPAGVVAIAGFYGVYRFVLSVSEAGLQRQLPNTARATATSVAALGGEVVGLAVYGLWALGGLGAISVAVLLVAAVALRRKSLASAAT